MTVATCIDTYRHTITLHDGLPVSGNRTVCNGDRGRESADIGRRLSQAASGRRKSGLFLPDRKALVRKMTGRRVGMPLGRMSPGVGLRPTPPPLFRPKGIPTRVPTCTALQKRKARESRFSSKPAIRARRDLQAFRSEEHTSELQSLMRTSYAIFVLKKQKIKYTH